MAFTQRRTRPAFHIIAPLDVLIWANNWFKRRQKRRELAKLLTFDERELKDIGVTHMDVREALAYRGNPALHLQALSARRRFQTRKQDRL
ncbi:MAG: DUF1127 domain-containing protein [Pseudomonadota bacterium]